MVLLIIALAAVSILIPLEGALPREISSKHHCAHESHRKTVQPLSSVSDPDIKILVSFASANLINPPSTLLLWLSNTCNCCSAFWDANTSPTVFRCWQYSKLLGGVLLLDMSPRFTIPPCQQLNKRETCLLL